MIIKFTVPLKKISFLFQVLTFFKCEKQRKRYKRDSKLIRHKVGRIHFSDRGAGGGEKR